MKDLYVIKGCAKGNIKNAITSITVYRCETLARMEAEQDLPKKPRDDMWRWTMGTKMIGKIRTAEIRARAGMAVVTKFEKLN